MKGWPSTPICPPTAVSEGRLSRCLAAAYSCSLCCLDLHYGLLMRVLSLAMHFTLNTLALVIQKPNKISSGKMYTTKYVTSYLEGFLGLVSLLARLKSHLHKKEDLKDSTAADFALSTAGEQSGQEVPIRRGRLP